MKIGEQHIINKHTKVNGGLGMVVHTSNPSYVGDIGKDYSLTLAQPSPNTHAHTKCDTPSEE
jgi:hypothetical protein